MAEKRSTKAGEGEERTEAGEESNPTPAGTPGMPVVSEEEAKEREKAMEEAEKAKEAQG
jgi:hypothetical protein